MPRGKQDAPGPRPAASQGLSGSGAIALQCESLPDCACSACLIQRIEMQARRALR